MFVAMGRVYLTAPAQRKGSVSERRVEGKEGVCAVTLKYPCVLPLMERCSVVETRRKIEAEFNSRCLVDNSALLSELVTLRHKKAVLMGYPSHAAFVTEDRMAKSADKVATFLSGLAAKLHPLLLSDLDKLRELKRAELKREPKCEFRV